MLARLHRDPEGLLLKKHQLLLGVEGSLTAQEV